MNQGYGSIREKIRYGIGRVAEKVTYLLYDYNQSAMLAATNLMKGVGKSGKSLYKRIRNKNLESTLED